jgi:hypothetical protein
VDPLQHRERRLADVEPPEHRGADPEEAEPEPERVACAAVDEVEALHAGEQLLELVRA